MINKNYNDLKDSDCVRLLNAHCDYLRSKVAAAWAAEHEPPQQVHLDIAQDLNEGKSIAILRLLELSST